MSLYTPGGRRKITPPIVFGLGVLWHLLRHGRRYDIVHTAAFPYFSVIAAAAARRTGRYSLFVDWHEVWTRAYWEEYLGRGGPRRLGGAEAVPEDPPAPVLLRADDRPALPEEGLRDPVTVLSGLYTGTHELSDVTESQPLVMFAGRHIPEKRVPDLVPAIERARERLPTCAA